MISGILHQGSGLGNQLHRYVATRVRAADLGVDFGMMYIADDPAKVKGFKGSSFMNLDLGKPVEGITKEFHENKILLNGLDIRGYDPEFNFVEDNTVIEGEFQDERYWQHREKEVNEWLKVEPLEIPDDVCVIGFRGGEYSVYPELFLTPDYWKEGIEMMKKVNPAMKFEVHTDDVILAKQFFPDYKAIQDIGINWRSMRFAKYAIIANSSFYIFPRWLRQGERNVIISDLLIPSVRLNYESREGLTIAPRYWARRNIKTWALMQNYYSRFQHI